MDSEGENEKRCSKKGCDSPIVTDSGRCPAHGEDGSEEMARRGREGGRHRQYGLDPEDLPRKFDTYEQVKSVLGKALRAVAVGELKASTGNTVARLVRAWCEIHQNELAADRMAEIEKKQKELRRQIEQAERQDDRPWVG